MLKKYIDVMVDVETLSTEPKAYVWNLGAIVLPDSGAAFADCPQFNGYVVPNSQEVLEACYDVNATTLEWTNEQRRKSPAFAENYDYAVESKATPKDLADYFIGFCKHHGLIKNPDVRWWCRGVDFDKPIIENLLKQNGHDFPWRYNQWYDLRTLSNYLQIKDKEVCGPNNQAHTALGDAIYQMKHLQIINLRQEQLHRGVAALD